MFVRLVFILSLTWLQVAWTGSKDLLEDAPFDQVATASENVAASGSAKEAAEKDFRDQLIPSMLDATVHYENSNGFVPMISPSSLQTNLHPPINEAPQNPLQNSTNQESTNNKQNSSTMPNDSPITEKRRSLKIEDDPAYSTEARIFFNLPQSGTNRRSFTYQDGRNEFELLKVNNDTPEIANYQNFYDNVQSNMDTESPSSSMARVRYRAKKIENYVNYGTDSTRDNPRDTSYDNYSYNTAMEKKKATYEQEKVASDYHQQEAANYDGHGRGAARQNEWAASSSRTNQEVDESTSTGPKNHAETYGDSSSSSSSKNRHKFSRPVVVAEEGYKADYKIADQPSKAMDPNSDDYPTSRVIDSASAETANRYIISNRDTRYRNYEDSRDMSDDSADYSEYTERPKRIHKSRRRPHASDSSKRYPKEHRGSLEDSSEHEDHSKRYSVPRTKAHRQRVKSNPWPNHDQKRGNDDSFEETKYDGRTSGSETRNSKTRHSKSKLNNGWSQISPNLEISHSSGIEIDQIEKPKYIVPVNVLPLGNFDHATALGSSQGFDVSNAVLQNFITAAPAHTASTVAPVLTSAESANQNLGMSNMQTFQNIGVSTQVPDVIFGQNTYQNPTQTLYVSQTNAQNKVRPQYVSSTISPVFTVSPNLSPTLPIQTLSSFIRQNPMQPNSEYNIQVNTHGLNGQNVVHHGNLQSVPSMATVTSTPSLLPVTKVNLVTSESQNKRNLLSGSSANFLASASLAVGQNQQKPQNNGNSYYLQSQNTQIAKPQVQDGIYQVLKNVNYLPKTKTFVQTTHVVPAVFQSLPTLDTMTGNQQFVPEASNVQGSNFYPQKPRDQTQQFVRIQNSGVDNAIQQLQLQIQREQMLKNKVPALAYQTIDNTGSQSNGNANTLHVFPSLPGTMENAHLPSVGTKSVEILNPNIKPSPIDTTILNAYETMHYPAAVLTTPIPMFSATSFVTARPALLSTTTADVNLQHIVDSLTELGSRNNQVPADLKSEHNQDRPMFNPINFVPNMEVVKNQHALNSKLHAEPLQQSLNLVPLIPGGNFFKPSFSAQGDLVVKPKLSSDLEKYAEQMFKESLKTIYNSHKWNNDRKPHAGRQNTSDSIDMAELKNELQRFKASLSDSKRNQDPFEASHSENKLKTADLFRGANSDAKKPDQLLAALEQVLSSHPTEPLQSYFGRNKHNHRPGDHHSNDVRDSKRLRDFLTPPKMHSHRAKFHEKPGKKRPGSGPARFNGPGHFKGSRSHSRPSNMAPKLGNLEVSASNVDLGVHVAESNNFEPRYQNPFDYKSGGHAFESYPSFTTSAPEASALTQILKNHKVSGGQEFDMNHPRMHNLLGLLMKNKQLPGGGSRNYFRDKDQLKQFFEDEKRRLQQQFYDDTLRDYSTKTADFRSAGNGGRVFAEKSST